MLSPGSGSSCTISHHSHTTWLGSLPRLWADVQCNAPMLSSTLLIPQLVRPVASILPSSLRCQVAVSTIRMQAQPVNTVPCHRPTSILQGEESIGIIDGAIMGSSFATLRSMRSLRFLCITCSEFAIGGLPKHSHLISSSVHFYFSHAPCQWEKQELCLYMYFIHEGQLTVRAAQGVLRVSPWGILATIK